MEGLVSTIDIEEVTPSKAGRLAQSFGSDWERHVHETAFKYTGSTVQILRSLHILNSKSTNLINCNDKSDDTICGSRQTDSSPATLGGREAKTVKLPLISHHSTKIEDNQNLNVSGTTSQKSGEIVNCQFEKQSVKFPRINGSEHNNTVMSLLTKDGELSSSTSISLLTQESLIGISRFPVTGSPRKLLRSDSKRLSRMVSMDSGKPTQPLSKGWLILRRKWYGGPLKLYVKKVRVRINLFITLNF